MGARGSQPAAREARAQDPAEATGGRGAAGCAGAGHRLAQHSIAGFLHCKDKYYSIREMSVTT